MVGFSAGNDRMVGYGHRRDSSVEVCVERSEVWHRWEPGWHPAGWWLVPFWGYAAVNVAVVSLWAGWGGATGWAQRVVRLWLVLDVVGLPRPRWSLALGIAQQAKQEPPTEDLGGVYLTKER